ncbi:MAG: tetratricopeptide repeat protein [Candidatus Zixiibacteriota bacterium]
MRTSLILALLLFVVTATAFADEPAQEDKSALELERVIPKSPIVSNVERLIAMKEYQRAIDLAEMYLAKEPGNAALKTLLAECYENTGQFDKLIAFLRERMASEPPDFVLYTQIGRAFLRSNQLDSAMGYFYRAAELAPENERRLRVITDYLQITGNYDVSIDFIDSLRTLSGISDLLAERMGEALTARKDFGAAAIEYLNYMDHDSASAVNGELKLVSMMEYPESVDTVMAVLSARMNARHDSRRLATTYGRLLIEQGKFTEARRFYQEMDSLKQNRGSDILYFIRQCNDYKQFQETLAAGRYMQQQYPDSPWLGTIQFAMADAYIGLQQYDSALALYLEVSRSFSRPVQKSEVNLYIGKLYKEYKKDPETAHRYFSDVIAHSPGTRTAVQAQFELAEVYVFQNQLDSASALYELLLNRDFGDEYAERISYILACIEIFQGKFEKADERFRQIITRYPRGLYVNDAIEYALIISESSSAARKQLDLFSAAEYYRYVGNVDSLEFYLKKICLVDIPVLAPLSYLRLAELSVNRADTAEALQSVDSLIEKYPESYFNPYGRKVKADILLGNTDRREEAIEIYRRLLEEYPKYPFAAEIRDILRHETEANQT